VTTDDPRPSSWRDRAGGLAGGLARGLRDEAARLRQEVAARADRGPDDAGRHDGPAEPARDPAGEEERAADAGPWAPLGEPGETTVVDTLTPAQFHTFPKRTPRQHRADVEVAGHRIDLSWVSPRTLVATAADGTELARGRRDGATDVGTFVWPYFAMPLDLLGEPVTVERRSRGAGWELVVVRGARRWSWRAGSGLWASSMELHREGERRPVVTHEVPPVFGPPQPLRVTWTAQAALAEVLMPVMWVLDRAYEGLLPKVQGAARGDVL